MSDSTITNNTSVYDIFSVGSGSLVHNTIVNNTVSEFTTLAIGTGVNLAGNIIANNTTLDGDCILVVRHSLQGGIISLGNSIQLMRAALPPNPLIS